MPIAESKEKIAEAEKRAEVERSRPWWAIWGFGIVIALCLWLAVSPDVTGRTALVCREYEGREVCINRIKRSARNYWEYRVDLTVEGQRQPTDLLDCRNQQRFDSDGFIEPFAPDDVGQFVCEYFNRQTARQNRPVDLSAPAM
ncbi:MAG: hypothetical protein ACFB9N_10640 [Geitlerinemataceae cyanobacterium]